MTKKTWFEEDKSVEEKLKVISEYDVAGIAAWKQGTLEDAVKEQIIESVTAELKA